MTNTNYFQECKTEQETKTAFRHLSKILHPDLGGTCELFRELEESYRAKLKSLHGSYNSQADADAGKNKYEYDEAIEQGLINKIRAVQGLNLDINIDLQGSWIWIRGFHKNNYGNYPIDANIANQLKKFGFKFHTMKKECYYRDDKSKKITKGKCMSYDRIAGRYKGFSFSNSGSEQLN